MLNHVSSLRSFITVWHKGLCAKLLELQLPTSVLRLHSLLGGQVKFAWEAPSPVSSLFTIASSPRRWLHQSHPLHHTSVVRDVPTPIPHHPTTPHAVSFSSLTGSPLPDSLSLSVNLTRILTDYLAYYNKWRMKVNNAKPQLSFGPGFSGWRQLKQFQNPITLNGTKVTPTKGSR